MHGVLATLLGARVVVIPPPPLRRRLIRFLPTRRDRILSAQRCDMSLTFVLSLPSLSSRDAENEHDHQNLMPVEILSCCSI